MKILLGKKVFFAAMVAAAALFSSCSKDDDEKVAYEGKWVSTEVDEDGLNSKTEATITKDAFEIKISDQFTKEDAALVNTMNLKGNLTVVGSTMTLSFTEISKMGEDGKMVTYKKGNPAFELVSIALKAFSSMTFKVEGDKLTLTPVVSGEEPFVFTRAK